MNTALNNDFNLEVDRLSKYGYTRAHNVDFSEEPEEEEVGMSQVSQVVEEVTSEEEIDLDMEQVNEEDLDTYEIEVQYAVEASMVSVAVVVKAME